LRLNSPRSQPRAFHTPSTRRAERCTGRRHVGPARALCPGPRPVGGTASSWESHPTPLTLAAGAAGVAGAAGAAGAAVARRGQGAKTVDPSHSLRRPHPRAGPPPPFPPSPRRRPPSRSSTVMCVCMCGATCRRVWLYQSCVQLCKCTWAAVWPSRATI
jgi:hypothetical protein